MMLAALGKPEEAERFYLKAIGTGEGLVARFPAEPEYRSNLANARNNLGDLLRELGRFKEAADVGRAAVSTYEELAREYPEDPDHQYHMALALSSLGSILAEAGQIRAADEAITRSLEIQEKFLAKDPGNPRYRARAATSHNNLAMFLAITQGPPYPGADRAVGLAKRATDLDPQSGPFWSVLGLAHVRAGNWRDGLAALDRAEQLGTNYGTSAFLRAIAHWRLGEKDEARRHYGVAARWLATNPEQGKDAHLLRDEAAAMLGITPSVTREKAPPPRRAAK
jgi:tetratricopeptide (TPR) repeat protein